MKPDKSLEALIEKELSKGVVQSFYDFNTKKMIKAKVTSTHEESLKKLIYQIAQKYAEQQKKKMLKRFQKLAHDHGIVF